MEHCACECFTQCSVPRKLAVECGCGHREQWEVRKEASYPRGNRGPERFRNKPKGTQLTKGPHPDPSRVCASLHPPTCDSGNWGALWPHRCRWRGCQELPRRGVPLGSRAGGSGFPCWFPACLVPLTAGWGGKAPRGRPRTRTSARARRGLASSCRPRRATATPDRARGPGREAAARRSPVLGSRAHRTPLVCVFCFHRHSCGL